jgi:hypothetical protein
MKNRFLIGVIYIITGLLIAVGPHTIFKVCDTSKMVMKCYWAAAAETGIGIIILAAGILYFLLGHEQAKLAISLLSIVTGIVAILASRIAPAVR